MAVDNVGKICTIDDPQVKLSPFQVSFEAIVMECSHWPGRRLAFSGCTNLHTGWREIQVNGAVFDVPEDVAEELLKLPANSEIVIHVVKMLPKIQGEASRGHTNMYGQFPQGGGRPSSIR
jgi:hypothetical protein